MAVWYAYYITDENKGILKEWEEVSEIIKGTSARYKKFKTKKEAKEWLDAGALYETKVEKIEISLDKSGIYFDSGTGRNGTPEIKVTNYKGDSLLMFVLPEEKISEFGTYFLNSNRTNNFGELTAIYAALKYALEYDLLNIYGDSQLVIDYWSKGKFNSTELEKDTISLINKVVKLREEFEKKGGTISFISGDYNPADLGFHK